MNFKLLSPESKSQISLLNGHQSFYHTHPYLSFAVCGIGTRGERQSTELSMWECPRQKHDQRDQHQQPTEEEEETDCSVKIKV